MPKHVLLNNIEHGALRVDTRRTAALGDDVMFAQTFPAEFRDLQAHYPVVFRKVADGTFQPIALLGFKEGQNLFLGEDGWEATYVPLAIERQPFLIGRDGEELLVHVDLENPRIGSEHGERLFRDHGGTTEYLDRISSVLLTLHNGLEATPRFVDALLRHELLESFALDVELDDGSLNRLVGFYIINEERLRALEPAALAALHQAGHLEAIYMAVASLSQLRALIERMNRRHAARR